MISIKQLCSKYETSLNTILKACWLLNIEFSFMGDSAGYADAYVSTSEVSLLNNYFNYLG